VKDLIMSVDCGTQHLRVILFNFDGDAVEMAKKRYSPYFSKNPGWAEQDPNLYWENFKLCCDEIKERQPELFKRIAAIAITTQRDTMINLDADGEPLRPAIVWLDQRKTSGLRERGILMKISHKIVGMDEAVRILEKDSKMNWIRINQPDIWSKTAKYLQVSGFFNFKLTGKFVDSVSSQIGHIPFDYKHFRWADDKDIKSILFFIEREKLPDIVEPGELIGNVTRKAFIETGIPEGVPVIAAGSDKGCETLGMGCLNSDIANISLGTTATIQVMSKRYFEPVRFIPPYPASIPHYYNPEVEIFRGYWMVGWFKDEFGISEVLEAERRGVPHEDVLNESMKDVKAGSMGLMVQPYWGSGIKMPEAKGSMIGFGDVHGRAHVYRAIIEGISYALLEGMNKIEKRGKVKIKSLTISGGGASSDEICQITSDIFNLPIHRGTMNEASSLGAAIDAAVGIKVYENFDTAVKKMVRYGTEFDPNAENAAIYRQLFEKVYLKIYPALKPIYKRIMRITNYPESQ